MRYSYDLKNINGLCSITISVENISEDLAQKMIEMVKTQPSPETSVDRRAIDLITEGSKLAAVKYIKEAMGYGLKEAKDYVDNLAEIYAGYGKTRG